MPRRTAVCRHVSHRVIYSRDTMEMSTYTMGSKNSAGARLLLLSKYSHPPVAEAEDVRVDEQGEAGEA